MIFQCEAINILLIIRFGSVNIFVYFSLICDFVFLAVPVAPSVVLLTHHHSWGRLGTCYVTPDETQIDLKIENIKMKFVNCYKLYSGRCIKKINERG